MAESRSGLNRERLEEILLRVREISSFPDDLAMDALDELIAALKDGPEPGVVSQTETGLGRITTDADEWGRNLIDEAMQQIKNTIIRLRAGSSIGGQQLLWGGQSLLREADRLDNYVHSKLKGEYKDEIATLRAEATRVARESQYSGRAKMIQEFAVQMIHNASSVKGILVGIDNALAALRTMGPVPAEIVETARHGKERAARYRAQKKLDEAEVTSAGGNVRKADKLRKEAAALLAQDWAQAFSDGSQ